MGFVLQKLRSPRIWERIFRERLSEPVHLNLAAAFVYLFGSLRNKIYFDLVVRPHYAFGLLNAADKAKSLGIPGVTAIEFGVANGQGVLNLCEIARRITDATGITFRILGFDTGTGMPPPLDYRDQPELYAAGDYPMQKREDLEKMLPSFAELVIGEVGETAPKVLERISPASPIGFAAVDVDYYSSTKDCLKLFDGDPTKYLPATDLYIDDIFHEHHNVWCGELLALEEFNAEHDMRKIAPHTMLRAKRLFKNAMWIDHMYTLHFLDHPRRSVGVEGIEQRVLDNPYLGLTKRSAR